MTQVAPNAGTLWNMLPAIVFPLHDPSGQWFGPLASITPQLKALFERAYVSVTPLTQQAQVLPLSRLHKDPFFQLNANPPGSQIGDHFLSGYSSAAAYPREQVLHLCFIDRVIFALRSGYCEPFLDSMRSAVSDGAPVLFQRSEAAWATHPRNYRDLEHMVTRAGELLFSRSFDWCWCHMALTAGQLASILPQVHGHDMSVLAEMVLALKDQLVTVDVDWLAWEDPFLFGRDPDALRREREASPAETHRRIGYVIPSLQVLYESAKMQREV
jgi:hypothetical protein